MRGTLIGEERESMTPSHTQVYQATHKDDQYLPYMNRSFISFSYGGKNIEDFNLLATIENNRLQRNAYSSFDDLTTIYDTLNGQFYWGSYYRANELTLNLATDGMTQNDLDNFKYWFKPGPGKELILSEHPNRAIIARIAEPPAFKLLPFEQKVVVPLGTGGDAISAEEAIIQNYTTSTTLYKGEIQLSFIMDEPFWYAKQNILGTQDVLQGYYSEAWKDANGKIVTVRDNKDALKIIYEDHIPLGSTTSISVFLGGNVFASVVYKLNSLIAAMVDTEQAYQTGKTNANTDISDAYFNNGDTIYNDEFYFPVEANSQYPEGYSKYYYGATVATMSNDDAIYVSGGRIGGAELSDVTEDDSGATLYSKDDIANLYYAGTAPSPVKLKFQITPRFNIDHIIICPQNQYSSSTKSYNTITLTATQDHTFKFTAPNIYNSHNRTIQIFDQFVREGVAWLTIREYIRDLVKHPVVRAWANRVIDKYDTSTGNGIVVNDSIIDDLKTGMEYLFHNATSVMPARFEFDAKTGKAIGTFTVRNPAMITAEDLNYSWNNMNINDEKLLTLTEDVGDMVKSAYLTLDERNVLDSSFQIQSWSADHPDYSYVISHDLDVSLEHLQFEFRNLYL